MMVKSEPDSIVSSDFDNDSNSRQVFCVVDSNSNHLVPEFMEGNSNCSEASSHSNKVVTPKTEDLNADNEESKLTVDELFASEENNKSEDVEKSDETGLLTTAMIKEEETLLIEGKKEEEQIKKKALEQWKEISEDMRMTQLHHLLEKSSIYANYLLGIIEKTKEKKEKRAKRKKQKLLKASENKEKPKVETPKQQTRKRPRSQEENVGTPAKQKRKEKEQKENQDGVSHPKADFEVGEKVQILQKADNEEDLINAKIVDTCYVDKKWKYLVHHLGTKKNKDKWVDKSVIITDITKDDEQEPKKSKRSLTDQEKAIAKIDQESLLQSKLHTGTQSQNVINIVDGVKYLNDTPIHDSQPILLTGGILRDYQVAGYEWLKILFENAVNGILADEMGLGKTIQCIALIARLVKIGVPGPFLVCAPMSTICNWISEFKRFTPRIPVMLYHGSAVERHILQSKIDERSPDLNCCPVVVTSYEIVMRDRAALSKYSFDYLVIDEGHRIKNMNCRLLKELKMLKVSAKLLLTGTPLQNSLAELWSLLNFLLPEVFNDLSTFEAWFDLTKIQKGSQSINSDKEKNVILMLHKILAPFLLRRTKADVDLELPPKREVLVFAPLSDTQHKFYQALTNRTIRKYLKDKEGPENKENIHKVSDDFTDSVGHKTRSLTLESRIQQEKDERNLFDPDAVVNISLNNVVMQLRKCCNHPYLIQYPLIPGTDIYRIDEELVTSCGKLQLLDRMLPVLQERGHKVLLFSQMTKILDVLEDYCRFRKYSHVRLDGSTKCEVRQQYIDQFNKDPEVFMFLLSTRAGGLGINLTAADTVIIYDSDWNPQNDLQAQDRCHRIGQTRPVIVYRFVSANTIDQYMVERAEAKRVLERLIMNRSKFKGKLDEDIKSDQLTSAAPSTNILTMLKDSANSEKSCRPISDDDLAKILDRKLVMSASDENIGCGLFRALD
uniref:Proliferation-associated SNF2-like protein n=1 Tax=Phallusia mammillata TaxID=59560 RepID=A0A6F9DF09_9ASCI|nr:lymphocyte-specific helicase-like [Phallusia mammillata]